MLHAIAPNEYADDPEIRKQLVALYDMPIFQNLMTTMEVFYARAYNQKANGTDAGSLGLAMGDASGRQAILDEMRSLDVRVQSKAIGEENYTTAPITTGEDDQ